jgi:NAD(P)H dehydrogenase (quinone)
MKHAIILGHPSPESFTALLAKTYEEMAAAMGHSSITRDLYRMDFDPRLQLSELPTRDGYKPAPDVLHEREAIGDADVFAFIYPLWFNTPPAILKGYIERVFGAGFGYNSVARGGEQPLLTGRQMIHVTASASSTAWLNEQGAWLSLHNLFETYFARICGMRVRPHIHFDSVVTGLTELSAMTYAHELRTKLQAYFAPDEPTDLSPSRPL